MKLFKLALATLSIAVAGCAKDDLIHTEGLTLTAGDAVARNSALQVIDPWPEGVENTELVTPAERAGKPQDGGNGGSVTAAPATN